MTYSHNTETIEEYYIVFTGSNHNNWMVRLLKSPFQHVYAIKLSPGGCFWTIIDPRATHTAVTTVPFGDFPHIRTMTNDLDVVLKVRVNIKRNERWTFCVINCVEIVKSLLGIRAFWIFTPYQLYKYLRSQQ